MIFVALFALLAILAVRFQAFLGASFQIIMVIMVFGAGINLFKAHSNNTAVALGLNEPFTLPLDQETLLRDVEVGPISTTLWSNQENIPTLNARGEITNNTSRWITGVMVTCFVSHASGQRDYSWPIPVGVPAGARKSFSGSIQLSQAISRENRSGYNCAVTRLMQKE